MRKRNVPLLPCDAIRLFEEAPTDQDNPPAQGGWLGLSLFLLIVGAVVVAALVPRP